MIFKNEKECIDYAEELRWNGNITSPFDENSIVYKCKNNKYKCKNTGKYFNVKTKTNLHGTRVPLMKWFKLVSLMSNEISLIKLAKGINVSYKTAWYMLKKLKSLEKNEFI